VKQVQPGTIIDERFEVLNEVGQGGMGVVYRARQKNMDRDVALKLLKTALAGNPDKVTRFQREARIISVLDHRNIVQIYATGFVDSGQPYIAMEFLTGRQLSDIIRERGAINWREAAEYTIQICDALDYAHRNNIIHRDIKPSNVVVCTDDTTGGVTIKLVDFGIAKSLVEEGPALTRTEMVMGSAFYLSPGQFQGRAADASSDIYSLGCTLFEMLSGTPPFVGDTIFDTVSKQANESLPKVNQVNPDAKIPQDLQRLLERMTEKESEHRLGSPAAVRELLQRILQGQSIELAAPATVPTKARPRTNILSTSLISIAILAIVCCAFALFHLNASHNTEQPIGPCLTKDPLEQDLVDKINRMAQAGSPSPKLGDYYRALAMFYRTNGMWMPGYLCAMESASVAGQADREVQVSRWVAGDSLMVTGRFSDAQRLLRLTALSPAIDPVLRGTVYASSLKSAFLAQEYDEGAKVSALLNPYYAKSDDNFAVPLLMVGAECELATAKLKDADLHLRMLSARLRTRPPKDPNVLRCGIDRLQLQHLMNTKFDQRTFDSVAEAVETTPFNVVYIGAALAHLYLMRGDEGGGISLIHRATESAVNMSGAPDMLITNDQCSLNQIEQSLPLISAQHRPEAERDRQKLVDKISSLKDRLNDRSLWLMPVPVTHANF
jgi:serine/threonine protein kinase